MTKAKPATPLPYAMVLKADVVVTSGIQTLDSEQDTDYLAHAANAYPKLVVMLDDIITDLQFSEAPQHKSLVEMSRGLLRELGEER